MLMLDPIRNSGVPEVSFTLKGKIINEYSFKFVHFSILLKISVHGTEIYQTPLSSDGPSTTVNAPADLFPSILSSSYFKRIEEERAALLVFMPSSRTRSHPLGF